jgi:putative spermidine/putrescine transport system permease protein
MTSGSIAVLRAYALLVGILMMLPLAVIVFASLGTGAFVEVPPHHIGLRWYEVALNSRNFVKAFLFSLETAAVVAVLATAIGIGCAMAIQRYRFPGRRIIEALVMAPLMLPHIVFAIGVLQLFSNLRIVTSPYGLVGGHVVIVLPFVVRLMMTGIAGLDPMLESASQSLGASTLDTIRRIVLPLMAPAALSAFVFAFLVSFDETSVSLFTSVPGATTLPVELLNYVEQRGDPLATAVSSMMIVIAVVVIVVVDHFFGLLRLLSGAQLGEART